MKFIQRIGILLMLLVFLYGTTGLSVLYHSCNSSNEKSVTVYPQFFKNSGSSCCADEATGYTCVGHNSPADASMPDQVDGVPCCKSIISFFKLEILTERADKLAVNIAPNLSGIFDFPLNIEFPSEQPLLKPVHFQFHSPPLYGARLVCYLHQLKIPAHLSVS